MRLFVLVSLIASALLVFLSLIGLATASQERVVKVFGLVLSSGWVVWVVWAAILLSR